MKDYGKATGLVLFLEGIYSIAVMIGFLLLICGVLIAIFGGNLIALIGGIVVAVLGFVLLAICALLRI